MDKVLFLNDLAEILEEDSVNETDVLADFDAWDSLSVLSIIAYASEHYKMQLKKEDIRSMKTVGDLMTLFESK